MLHLIRKVALLLVLLVVPFPIMAQEISADLVGGSVKMGFDNRTCDAMLEGAFRYNSSTSCTEYCDASNWTCLGGGGGGGVGFDGPADCANIGDQCSDGTIFAGYHNVSHEAIFLHPNNQSTGSAWSTQTGVETSTNSKTDGEGNHNWIVTNMILTNYPAFKVCDDLNQSAAHGHTDWYLPGYVESYFLYLNKEGINNGPGDAFADAQYWTSRSPNSNAAYYTDFSTGQQSNPLKTSSKYVRCIRAG